MLVMRNEEKNLSFNSKAFGDGTAENKISPQAGLRANNSTGKHNIIFFGQGANLFNGNVIIFRNVSENLGGNGELTVDVSL